VQVSEVCVVEARMDLRFGERQAAEVPAHLEPPDRWFVEAQARSHSTWVWAHRGLGFEPPRVCATADVAGGTGLQPQPHQPLRRAAEHAREPLGAGLAQALLVLLAEEEAE
jgi:hypothetical protein